VAAPLSILQYIQEQHEHNGGERGSGEHGLLESDPTNQRRSITALMRLARKTTTYGSEAAHHKDDGGTMESFPADRSPCDVDDETFSSRDQKKRTGS
jgi:hypothetical protein